MNTKTYNALEGELSIRPSPTVSRSGANNAVTVIGGADLANADVVSGEVTAVTDPVNAEDQLGDSEIARAAEALTANGANEQYAIPVPETETTESFAATQELSLSNDPIFDPSVHPDHEIVVTDAVVGEDLVVELVYDDPVSVPSESNVANVNPVTGDIACDESSDYDVTYTYGDYQTAIEAATETPARYLCPLTENPSVKASVITAMADIAADFDFKRAVVGATPDMDATQLTNYTPSERDWRLVEVAPARATGSEGTVRTQAAVCGLMASQPIGPDGSGLFDTLSGLTELNRAYRGTEAKSVEGVTSVTRSGTIAQAITTSTADQFQNVYATEIIDEVALRLFDVVQEYAGGPQDIGDLQALLRGVCQSASSGSPPLLGFPQESDASPYDVSVDVGADPGVADASISIVPTPIADQVNIGVTVTDGFVSFSGAE